MSIEIAYVQRMLRAGGGRVIGRNVACEMSSGLAYKWHICKEQIVVVRCEEGRGERVGTRYNGGTLGRAKSCGET